MREYIDGILAEYGAFVVVILSVVFVKWLWSETKRSWMDWVRHLAVSLLVGSLMFHYLNDIPEASMGDGTKGVILALVVLQADAIFVGLLSLGQRFRHDPAGVVQAIYDIWRGKK